MNKPKGLCQNRSTSGGVGKVYFSMPNSLSNSIASSLTILFNSYIKKRGNDTKINRYLRPHELSSY